MRILTHCRSVSLGKALMAAMTVAACATVVHAQNVVLPEVAKRGKVVVGFTKQRAMEHCTKQGKRLPSVRELAMWAQARGAIGIEESANKRQAYPLEIGLMAQKGFDAVYLHQSYVQTVVDFYFNPKGFKRNVRGAVGQTRIWAADTLNVAGVDAYTFTPGYPTFRPDSSAREFAVACVH